MSSNGTVNTRYSIINCTQEAVQHMGGENIQVTKHSGIIFADLTTTEANDLRNSGCIVELVGKMRMSVVAPPIPTPPVPTEGVTTYTPLQLSTAAGYDKVRAMIVPPLYGEGFNLAIIGTGIRETHELIGGRVVYSKNYTIGLMRDGFNHDSGVCGIALSVAPKANILNMKVMDDAGEGTEEEVVFALDDCISLLEDKSEFAPHVVNLSLGSPDDGNPNNVLRVACRTAIDRGIWIFAAAGNGGPYGGTIMNPACERYVGAVGSTSYEPFQVSSFSSVGPTAEGLVKPDAVMFGENIVMASSESDTATTAKSGTSFATPFISGLALIVREGQYRKATLTEPIPEVAWAQGWSMSEQDLLDSIARYICIKPQGVASGKDTTYGWGVPFGELVTQVLQPTAAVGIGAIVPMIMVMGMMGVMMKVVVRKEQVKR